MVIYLQHPEHGRKVATLEEEALYDEKNGWTRFYPDAPAPVAAEETPQVNALAGVSPIVGRRRTTK
jgi:hypothetical protein